MVPRRIAYVTLLLLPSLAACVGVPDYKLAAGSGGSSDPGSTAGGGGRGGNATDGTGSSNAGGPGAGGSDGGGSSESSGQGGGSGSTTTTGGASSGGNGTGSGGDGGSSACSDPTQCNLCNPGARVCNGNVPLVCDAKGQYTPEAACSGDTPLCEPTTALCVACLVAADCAPSANECLNPLCSNHTCAYAPKTPGTACTSGTCSSVGTCQACTPGKSSCDGESVLHCNAGGQYDTPLACSGSTPYCNPTAPACVECTSTSQCAQPSNPCLQASCMDNACGLSNKADGATCAIAGDSGTCHGGSCQLCTQGQTRCKAGSGSVVQSCDANGRWVDGQICSGATPTCSAGSCGSRVDSVTTSFGYQLKRVSSGTYELGKPNADPSDYAAPHTVTLTRDYMVGTTEITQNQYQLLMGTNPSATRDGCNSNDPLPQSPEEPVNCVSWDDAVAFANAVSSKENLPHCYTTGVTGTTWPLGLDCKGYRLPTEAEWEVAARGGESWMYAGGDDLSAVGWYSANSGGRQHPVGQKKPNAYGLYDMSGNASEHVWDVDAPYPTSPSPLVDPLGPSSGGKGITRGGNHYWGADQGLVYDRQGQNPRTWRGGIHGIRLVRTAP